MLRQAGAEPHGASLNPTAWWFDGALVPHLAESVHGKWIYDRQ